MTEHTRFAIRGVIEGFYGTPWSHEERLDMIDFLGRNDYNTYVYSPKDDPYLRDRWMQPHPKQDLERFREGVAAAKKRGIRYVYALSPGFGMKYASFDHLRLLIAKYHSLYEQGVRDFALLFDDIPLKLMHTEDREQFSQLAEAHVHTTTQVWEEMSTWPDMGKLFVCPTQYSGIGDESYIVYMGRHLPKAVEVFWTGRFVCSPSLTSQDTMRYLTYTQRMPLYWDNYPVNDLAMADELHIGPLRNRDRELCHYAVGYVANAMSRPEASKIPLMTTATYLKNPEAYDPIVAWNEAIAAVAGEQQAAFRRFAEHVQGSFLHDIESPGLLEALLQFRFHFLRGDARAALQELRALFVEMETTARALLADVTKRKLIRECREWIEKYEVWGEIGQAAVALMEAGTNGKMAQGAIHLLRLKRLVKRVETMPQKVCGNVMSTFVEAVFEEVKKRR